MKFKYLKINTDDTWEWKEEKASNPYNLIVKELGYGYFTKYTLIKDLLLFYDDYEEHGEELNCVASSLCFDCTYGKCLAFKIDNRGLNKYLNKNRLFPKLRGI